MGEKGCTPAGCPVNNLKSGEKGKTESHGSYERTRYANKESRTGGEQIKNALRIINGKSL